MAGPSLGLVAVHHEETAHLVPLYAPYLRILSEIRLLAQSMLSLLWIYGRSLSGETGHSCIHGGLPEAGEFPWARWRRTWRTILDCKNTENVHESQLFEGAVVRVGPCLRQGPGPRSSLSNSSGTKGFEQEGAKEVMVISPRARELFGGCGSGSFSKRSLGMVWTRLKCVGNHGLLLTFRRGLVWAAVPVCTSAGRA